MSRGRVAVRAGPPSRGVWCGVPRRVTAYLTAIAAVFALAMFVHDHRAAAQGNRGWVSDGEAVVQVSLTVNKSHTFHVQRQFKQAVVGAPDIVDAMPVTDRTLYLLGKKIGATNVSVFAANGDLIGVLDVIVEADVGDLRRKIDLRGEKGGIRVSSENGQVVLSGMARDAVAAERAVVLAKAMSPNASVVNAMTVAPSQQVMLKVRFLEATRQAERDLGVNWFVGGGNLSGAATGLGTVASGAANGLPLFQTAGTILGNGGAPFGVALANLVNSGTKVDVLVSALETKGLVRSLADPIWSLYRATRRVFWLAASFRCRSSAQRRPASPRRRSSTSRSAWNWISSRRCSPTVSSICGSFRP